MLLTHPYGDPPPDCWAKDLLGAFLFIFSSPSDVVSVVMAGVDKRTNDAVALKQMSARKHKKMFRNEVYILSLCKHHPNVVYPIAVRIHPSLHNNLIGVESILARQRAQCACT